MAPNNKSRRGRTKSEIYQMLAEKTGLSRKQVAAVIDELINLVKSDVGKTGPGIFTVSGLLKIKRVTKPATEERTMPNPFKPGEMMTVKAKPERNVVKALALKSLKDAAK